MTQQKGKPKVKVNASHVRHGLCKQYGFCTAGFVKPFYPLFLLQTRTGKGKLYIVVRLCHCAFLL